MITHSSKPYSKSHGALSSRPISHKTKKRSKNASVFFTASRTTSLPSSHLSLPSFLTVTLTTPALLGPTLVLPSFQSERQSPLPTLCLVYITLGCTVVLMLVSSLCIFYLCKRRQRKKEQGVFSYCPSEQETSRTSLSHSSRRQDPVDKEAYVPPALYPPNFSGRRSHRCPSPFETGSETDQYSLSAFQHPRHSQGTMDSFKSRPSSIYSPFSDTWEAKHDSL
ncbi:hypothetical protein BY458DRAFT_487803 [Sporodiniella umbellata]|nr:hypothetical protein BY458DRAFT_487803 [Sporodiniella umbellata]